MKYHPNKNVLFVTFSIEEGLLLLSNPLCEAIIKSCLAAGQALYPVKICHLLVEATHVHMVLVVDNPDDVPAFIGYFKAETAHRINSLLGRDKRTVWCEGYDSPIVLTPRRALSAIAYLYANPAKDNLEVSIDQYPGFSSWKMFQSGELKKRWKRLRRPLFRFLPHEAQNSRGYQKEADRLLKASKEEEVFTLEPNAWLDAFGIVEPEKQEKANAILVNRIETLEERAAQKRAKEGKRVIGRERLRAAPLDTSYRPQRSGKRMWCLSEKISLRKAFIAFLKSLMEEAREVLEKWRTGDTAAKYPPGLHPPSMPKLANALSL